LSRDRWFLLLAVFSLFLPQMGRSPRRLALIPDSHYAKTPGRALAVSFYFWPHDRGRFLGSDFFPLI
jgi:hypothetical protein